MSSFSQIEYQLVRSRRKSLAIHVLRDGSVEVRAPHRAPRELIHRFVLEKSAWIKQKRTEWLALPARHEPKFHEGAEHFFLGEAYRLSFAPYRGDDPVINLQLRSTTEDNVARALDRWYRREAERLFAERHDHWRDQMADFALPQSHIRLRKMTSRWGSCTRRGAITLNTQLVRYPLECADAVIVHELCHLLEFNHSPRFYALMDRAYPDWKPVDKLLKKLALQY